MTSTLARPRLCPLRYEPGWGARAVVARRLVAIPEPFVPPALDTEGVRRTVDTTLRLAVEVFDGRRPSEQLATRLDRGTLRRWRAQRTRTRKTGVSRVLRLRLCLPHAEAAEVAAVCRIDGRVRALAARFEREGPLWTCTLLQLV
jgi:hypothetical protein